MLAAHVALLEGIGLDAARQRLGVLTRAGYVSSERRYVAEPRAYMITRDGRGVARSGLSQPRKLDPALYAHDVGVTWLTAAARRGLFGELAEVVSERRMRSEDGRGDGGHGTHGARYIGSGGGWAGGARRLHYPDLTVVTAAGQRVAFELELQPKGAARRERILSAFAGDPRFDAVVYLVTTQQDRRLLEASARRAGLEDRLYVQLFSWSGGHEPGAPPSRAASRAPSRTPSRAAATRAHQTGPASR